MGGGLESRCVGRVCGADVAVRVARCRNPYAATQRLMLLMMGVYPKHVELRIH